MMVVVKKHSASEAASASVVRKKLKLPNLLFLAHLVELASIPGI